VVVLTDTATFVGPLRGRQLGAVYVRGESKLIESPDAVPVEVNLIPLQTVPGRDGVGMMVVVPTLAKRENRHPPAIGRSIPGLKAARTPKMRGRVYKPSPKTVRKKMPHSSRSATQRSSLQAS